MQFDHATVGLSRNSRDWKLTHLEDGVSRVCLFFSALYISDITENLLLYVRNKPRDYLPGSEDTVRSGLD